MDRLELLRDNEEALRIAMDGRLTGLHTAMPGIIESIDFVAQTVSVQPSIQGIIVTTKPDGTIFNKNVDLPILADVPIFILRGGEYAITVPVAIGDECLVIFGDRCIDSWWQSGKVGPQIDFTRMHDLSDSFAIVGFTSQPNVIPAVSNNSLQIRKLDGSTYIELSGSGISLITNQNLTCAIDGDILISSNDMQFTATGNISLDADVINLTCNVLNINAGEINGL